MGQNGHHGWNQRANRISRLLRPAPATGKGEQVKWHLNDPVTGTRVRMVALVAAIAAAIGMLATPATAQVRKETPKGTEVGVTPSEIHIAVIADVDNPLVP